MKKILVLLIALFLVTFAVSCGKNKNDANTNGIGGASNFIQPGQSLVVTPYGEVSRMNTLSVPNGQREYWQSYSLNLSKAGTVYVGDFGVSTDANCPPFPRVSAAFLVGGADIRMGQWLSQGNNELRLVVYNPNNCSNLIVMFSINQQ